MPSDQDTLPPYELLDKICKGNGEKEDIDRLISLGTVIKDTSLCGLGQSSPNPILATLNHFMHEYEAHVEDKKCPSGVCKALMVYDIVAEKGGDSVGGVRFVISNNKAKDVIIEGEKLNPASKYWMVTNDYSANGGDDRW